MTFISQEFLDDLLAQEERLQFPSFDNDAAIALGLLLVELGRARRLPITVDVTRAGQQLFHAALSGTTADNARFSPVRSASFSYRRAIAPAKFPFSSRYDSGYQAGSYVTRTTGSAATYACSAADSTTLCSAFRP